MSNQAQGEIRKTTPKSEACEAEVSKICKQIIDLAYELNKALDRLNSARLLESGEEGKEN